MQMPEAKSEMRAEFWSGSETYRVDDPGDCHERWLACKTPCRQYTSLELDLPLSNERIRQDVLPKLLQNVAISRASETATTSVSKASNAPPC